MYKGDINLFAHFGAAANYRSLVKKVFGAAIMSPLSN
jgi:hypothetical protein